MDITGDGAIEFFSNRIKITSKWPSLLVPSSIGPTTASTMNGTHSCIPSITANHIQNTSTMDVTTTTSQNDAQSNLTTVDTKDMASFAGSM
jgi:hypothetical protein